VPAGSYTFTAVATDTGNVSTTSSPVTVSVGAAVVTHTYYIYTDQLNTPRLITDTANTAVWRNDQTDPFNAGAPYDDPNNTGHHFFFNLRFPGQYYDQETGLNYNYFRDYDPSTGRYVESDPIGLIGGLNTYGYANQNPLKFTDPEGLDPFGSGSSTGSGGFTPAPTPFDVFTPGTSANNTFVQSVYQMGRAVKNICTSEKSDCDREWREARETCKSLIYEQLQQQAGRRKKRSVIGVTGGFTDIEQCARGLVSELCGGNLVR
ncbi:MAG: RHS repeat-associated core domain-containing protein, partial [Sulfuriferula sp.]